MHAATEIVPIAPPTFAGLAFAPESIDLFAAVLSGRNARTVRAYEGDFRDFARFLGLPAPGAALDALIAGSQGHANAIALAYRAHLIARNLATATVARRLAALRSAVKLARQLGRLAWALEVEAPRTTSYRDTAGPGRDGWRALLELAKGRATTPRGRRDLALIRLLHDVALRRAEAVALDLADVDLERGAIMVVGKGRTEPVPITLPGPTRAALADWIVLRGAAPGPLFPTLGPASKGARLSGRAVHKIVGALGRRAKLSRPVRPHGLRHQGITRALDVSGGDVRAVRKFSRHANLNTLTIYDDARIDLAGRIADAVADD